MSGPCPYCLVRQRDSHDHVFPDFLGGTRTVPVCRQCNNGFGTRFEGPVSRDLTPIIVVLCRSGYKHKRRVVYKRAWVDTATGIEYDLDSEGVSCPNKPHLISEDGQLKRIVARSLDEVHKIADSLKRKGKISKFIPGRVDKEIPTPPLQNSRINVGIEMRQLAVKMCVAVGQLTVPNLSLLEDQCRQFLLDESPSTSPVRLVHSHYPQLDALRPVLAHTVYIEGDSACAKCFGVVQFFGCAFSLYVPLNNSYAGPDFAALGTLNIKSFDQEFRLIQPLKIPEAPQFVGLEVLERSLAQWAADFNAGVKSAFGENGLLVELMPKQTVGGVGINMPLLWIEHELNISLDMELVPDQEQPEPVQLANDPRLWVITPDYGKTTLQVFDRFAQKWNNNAINRTLGQEHVYEPDEIVPGREVTNGRNLLVSGHFDENIVPCETPRMARVRSCTL